MRFRQRRKNMGQVDPETGEVFYVNLKEAPKLKLKSTPNTADSEPSWDEISKMAEKAHRYNQTISSTMKNMLN